MVVMVGLGLGVIFEQYPVIHDVIKVLGIVYLIYLAWQIAHVKKTSLSGKVSTPFTFIQAALFQWVNPKAWVMASTSIAVYTSVAGNMCCSKSLLLAAVFVFTGLCCSGSYMAVFREGFKAAP